MSTTGKRDRQRCMCGGLCIADVDLGNVPDTIAAVIYQSVLRQAYQMQLTRPALRPDLEDLVQIATCQLVLVYLRTKCFTFTRHTVHRYLNWAISDLYGSSDRPYGRRQLHNRTFLVDGQALDGFRGVGRDGFGLEEMVQHQLDQQLEQWLGGTSAQESLTSQLPLRQERKNQACHRSVSFRIPKSLFHQLTAATLRRNQRLGTLVREALLAGIDALAQSVDSLPLERVEFVKAPYATKRGVKDPTVAVGLHDKVMQKLVTLATRLPCPEAPGAKSNLLRLALLVGVELLERDKIDTTLREK